MRGESVIQRRSAMRSVMLTSLAVFSIVLFGGDIAEADDTSGTITTTLTIFRNSRLVGDVTCAVVDQPCIRFGASHIQLRLNGFTMTGRADPPNNCVPHDSTLVGFLPEDGITTEGWNNVAILGPGLIQKFRRYGIIVGAFPNPSALAGSSVIVRQVTSHHNCFSGIQLAFVSNSRIEDNVSVRNASGSAAFPCGGTCILQSDNNRIRRNIYSGNGSTAGGNNDFGVGLLAGSDRNVIEGNIISGNTNGVWVVAAVGTGNIVRRNIITGNPPVELVGATGTGVDIRDLSPAGTVTFSDNLCITYQGSATPRPCHNIPRFTRPSLSPDQTGNEDREEER
jgi:parallel beta-helix repeat protein